MTTVHHSDDSGEGYHYNFRPIYASKLRFSVQAEKNVALCLTVNDDNESDMYQLFIGCWGGGESGIRKGKHDDILRVETPDILSEDEFRSFWVSVRRGRIKVGKKGELSAFMSFEDHDFIRNAKYYGFATGWGSEGDWMFNDEHESGSSSSSSSGISSSDSEAEELNLSETKPILYKRPARWVYGKGGNMPHHPISGGEGETGTVYVGMAEHEGGHILGMVVPEESLCYIPYGGEAIPKEDYYVLGNPRNVQLQWIGASAGKVPSGALQGGHSESGEPLYIGRVSVDGVVSCGKVHPSHGCCYVPYHGQEHKHRDYEVLCATDIPCGVKI